MEAKTRVLPQKIQHRQDFKVDLSLVRLEWAFTRVEGSMERIERLLKQFDELEKTAR